MPELTGKRRYRYVEVHYEDDDDPHFLMVLQVEEAVFTTGPWKMTWRDATPEDLLTETVVGLPASRG